MKTVAVKTIAKKIVLTFSLCLASLFTSLAAAAEQACESTLDAQEILTTVQVSSWGFNIRNTRFQPADLAGLKTPSTQPPALQWAFDFRNAFQARSQPVVTQQAIFTGSQSGNLYALDRQSGCVFWKFKASAEVRTGIVLGTNQAGDVPILYFGDFLGTAYAVNAATGNLIWRKTASNFYAATITGTPVLHDGVLYVPISSLEVGIAAIPFYPCCRFQGQVTAMNAYTGEWIWNKSVMTEVPKRVGKNSWYTANYSPSGAPVWSTPTIDVKRNRLYVGTGQSYMPPAADTTDSIVAMDLDTGDIVWKQQMTANDNWNISCIAKGPNCPEPGVDFDFGAPPILLTLQDGTDRIFAGQKSGMVYALDPDKDGAQVWQTRVGRGGALGGIHWGIASDGERIYVPVSDSDLFTITPGTPRPGLYALDPATGDVLWESKPQYPCGASVCTPSFSAAITVIPGAVLAGDLEGYVTLFDSANGKVLWTFDTDLRWPSVNGRKANGGSIDSGGPIIAGGQIFVNSGYGLFGKKPGNAFLVLQP